MRYGQIQFIALEAFAGLLEILHALVHFKPVHTHLPPRTRLAFAKVPQRTAFFKEGIIWVRAKFGIFVPNWLVL